MVTVMQKHRNEEVLHCALSYLRKIHICRTIPTAEERGLFIPIPPDSLDFEISRIEPGTWGMEIVTLQPKKEFFRYIMSLDSGAKSDCIFVASPDYVSLISGTWGHLYPLVKDEEKNISLKEIRLRYGRQ